MNEQLIEHRLKNAEADIKDHGSRIDKIESSQAEFKVQMLNLCKDISGLTAIMKWLVGLLASALIDFLFYIII